MKTANERAATSAALAAFGQHTNGLFVGLSKAEDCVAWLVARDRAAKAVDRLPLVLCLQLDRLIQRVD